MATKNRSKQQAPAEKSPPPVSHEDAPKKSAKGGNGGAGAQAPAQTRGGPGLCSRLATTLFYVVLVASGGFAAIYLQRTLEEMKLVSVRSQRSAEESLQVAREVDGLGLREQVASLSSAVGVLQAAVGAARAEHRATASRLEQAEQQAGRGPSSPPDQELARSVEALAAAQTAARSQMEALETLVGLAGDPAALRRELAAVTDAAAALGEAQAEARRSCDAAAAELREQVGAVSGELLTRNQEVASLAEELAEVRRTAQDAASSLRGALADAQAGLAALGTRALALEEEGQRVARSLQAVEEVARAGAGGLDQETEARLRAQEEGGEALGSALSTLASRVEALLAQLDDQQSGLAALARDGERDRDALRKHMEALEARLEEQLEEQPPTLEAEDGLEEAEDGLEEAEDGLEEAEEGLEEQEGDLDAAGQTSEEEHSD